MFLLLVIFFYLCGSFGVVIKLFGRLLGFWVKFEFFGRVGDLEFLLIVVVGLLVLFWIGFCTKCCGFFDWGVVLGFIVVKFVFFVFVFEIEVVIIWWFCDMGIDDLLGFCLLICGIWFIDGVIGGWFCGCIFCVICCDILLG